MDQGLFGTDEGRWERVHTRASGLKEMFVTLRLVFDDSRGLEVGPHAPEVVRDRIREQLEFAYVNRDCSFVSARWSESDTELTGRFARLRDCRRDSPADVDWNASVSSPDEGVQVMGGGEPPVDSEDSEMGSDELVDDDVFDPPIVENGLAGDPIFEEPVAGAAGPEVSADNLIRFDDGGHLYPCQIDPHYVLSDRPHCVLCRTSGPPVIRDWTPDGSREVVMHMRFIFDGRFRWTSGVDSAEQMMKRVREAVDAAYVDDQVTFLQANFEEPDSSLRGRFQILRERAIKATAEAANKSAEDESLSVTGGNCPLANAKNSL